MAARPLHAQQKAMPVIGFLNGTSPGLAAAFVAAFHQGLSETGYVEGQNLAIEYRWAEGHYDRLPALAADLVARKVDVIATSGTPPALAAKIATSTIPIVFSVGDPVELGLVASLARPGGNLIGLSNMNVELNPKRLELLSELVPQAKVIALLLNQNNRNTERNIKDVQEAAHAKGLQLHILKAGTESEIDAAFATLVQLRRRCARRRHRPVPQQPARPARGIGMTSYRPSDILLARVRRRRRLGQLWTEPDGCLSPDRRLRRKDPQGRQAGRPAGPAANNLRAGRQSQHRQGAGAHRAAVDPRPRR
jgi:hypothetical protein